jgi:hypothetical protein
MFALVAQVFRPDGHHVGRIASVRPTGSFLQPTAVTVDGEDNLIVFDCIPRGGRLHVLTQEGTNLASFRLFDVYVTSICVGEGGSIFMSVSFDHHRSSPCARKYRIFARSNVSSLLGAYLNSNVVGMVLEYFVTANSADSSPAIANATSAARHQRD